MKEGFLQFHRPPRKVDRKTNSAAHSKESLAAVCKSGVLRLNPAAVKQFELSKGDKALLFYHPGKKIIGLKITKEETTDAASFYDTADGFACLTIKTFMRSAGIAHATQSRRRVSLDKETGMILIHDVMDQKAAEFQAAVERSGEEPQP